MSNASATTGPCAPSCEDPTAAIDRETGEYLGDRAVVLDSAGGIPAGTTMTYTAVSTAVVDGQGERPGK